MPNCRQGAGTTEGGNAAKKGGVTCFLGGLAKKIRPSESCGVSTVSARGQHDTGCRYGGGGVSAVPSRRQTDTRTKIVRCSVSGRCHTGGRLTHRNWLASRGLVVARSREAREKGRRLRGKPGQRLEYLARLSSGEQIQNKLGDNQTGIASTISQGVSGAIANQIIAT